MLSYHNKQELKDKYVAQMIKHRKADQLVKGQYWQEGKGCAIGCLVYSASHKQVEEEVGIPEWLAQLIDYLFENLPNGEAIKFPEKILKAIPVGKDLTVLKHKFFLFLLNDVCKDTDNPIVKQSIDDIKDLHMKVIEGKPPTEEQWESAASAAWFAAYSTAYSAAWDAAYSAAYSAAQSTAWDAAWSGESAAYSAAQSAARSAVVIKIADGLIKLLKEEK